MVLLSKNSCFTGSGAHNKALKLDKITSRIQFPGNKLKGLIGNWLSAEIVIMFTTTTRKSLIPLFHLFQSHVPYSQRFVKEGGVQAYHFEKHDFALGVKGEGQDTGVFGSMRAMLPM